MPAQKRAELVRSLVREAARAELWSQGLLIDLGSPDQNKYIGCTVSSRQNRAIADQAGDTSVLSVAAHALLGFHDAVGGARQIVVRARSAVAGQSLSLLVDGKETASRELSRAWRTIRFPLSRKLDPGPRVIVLLFSRQPEENESAQIDWVWLATEDVAESVEPPVLAKVAVRSFGEPLRAMVADPPRALSFYLVPPSGARLALRFGARQRTRFTVRVKVDGRQARTVLERNSGGGRWQQASIDLADLAGTPLRLELETTGPRGEAGWGQVDINSPLAQRLSLADSPSASTTAPAATAAAGPPARNVVHIVLDAARADSYRAYNPAAEAATPGTSQLAHNGVVFTRAYATSNWTLPSVASMLSGRYGWTFMPHRELARLPADLPLLQEHLQKHNLVTAAIVGNPFISEKFGFKRGWSHFRNLAQEAEKLVDAAEIYEAAIRWLEANRSRRFYLFLHAMEGHEPYHHREGAEVLPSVAGYRGRLGRQLTVDQARAAAAGRSKLSPADLRFVRGLYAEAIAYHDRQMAGFLDRLQALGLLEQSLVAFTGDHGQELFDRGKFGHGHSLHEEVIHVPLVLTYPPRLGRGARVESIVELVDLPATITDLLDLPAMSRSHGVSLLGAVRGRPALAAPTAFIEHDAIAVRVASLKLVRTDDPPRRAREALFDLATDPEERRDLGLGRPVALRLCQIHLGEALGAPAKASRLEALGPTRTFTATKPRLDPAIRRQLENLGYTGR